ncbi:MAG: secretin N-terminal domain-containing protein [Planctomycetota bacterium]
MRIIVRLPVALYSRSGIPPQREKLQPTILGSPTGGSSSNSLRSNCQCILLCCVVMIGLAVLGGPITAGNDKAKGQPTGFRDQPDQITTFQPPLDPKIQEGLSKMFSLKVKEINIKDFLTAVQKLSNLNIVATKEVAGSLTFLLDKVTIGDALEIALITNKLAKEIKGNIINIMTEAEYQLIYGDAYNSRRIIKTYRLQNISAKKMRSFLDSIKTAQIGKIIEDEGTGTLIVMDVPDKFVQIDDVIKRLDVPFETRIFELKYARVKDIMDAVTKALTKEGYGEIKVDERMNRLIVNDAPRNMDNIATLIKALDGKPRQVLIETKMIQIVLSNEFSMGIDWQQVFSKYSKWEDAKFVGTFPMAGTIGKVTNLSAQIGTIPATHYQLVLKALQAFGANKMISAPRLIAMQDKPAKFMVGSKEAYVTVTTTQTQASTTSSESVQFEDVGILLEVTPIINEDGFVEMKIKPEISSVTKQVQTSSGNIIPIVEKATTDTVVMVKDGVTIVIAGLIKDEKQSQKNGVPILSQIPIIGMLFGSTVETTAKTETVIFLTPYIISGDVDASILSKKKELEELMDKKLKELKPIK